MNHQRLIAPILSTLGCFTALLLSSVTLPVEAHSGGTDSRGCHTNRKTGDYHCHGGRSSRPSSTEQESYSSPSRPSSPPAPRQSQPAVTPQSQPLSVPKLPPTWNRYDPVTVLSVGDGDTIRIEREGEAITVRLACIDAPETAQAPYGEAASERLQALLPVGSSINVRPITEDRYGRTVGEVFVEGKNLGPQLLVEGHAVAYRQYLSQCDANVYLSAEYYAQRLRLGFWEPANPVMPWDFRKGSSQNLEEPTAAPSEPIVRPAEPEPVYVELPEQPILPPAASQSCDPNYAGACIPPYSKVGDLNCGDIQARRFRSIGRDPHRLDGDQDGIACEAN